MKVTEELVGGIVKALKGSYKIKIHKEGNQALTHTEGEAKQKGTEESKEDDMIEIDFTPPWPRVPMLPTLEKHLGESIPKDLESEETRQFFDK